jgi:hypothetical protein
MLPDAVRSLFGPNSVKTAGIASKIRNELPQNSDRSTDIIGWIKTRE